MRILDFFRVNDWNIRRFNIIIISLLIAYDGIFLTNKFLFKVPILSQLLGFTILTFIPGFIILRILRVHNIDRTTNILLAVGLSLSFIMIFGFIVNVFLPHLGIKKPIMTFPLFCSLNFAIIFMLFTSYLRDRNFKESQALFNIEISPLLLFLAILPFLGIFGAYFMTFYNLNAINLFLLFLISIIPVLVAFEKVPKKLYPFLIFAVSLSILYHVNLISTYLWSYDIFPESYSSNLVVEKGIWDPSLKYNPLLLFAILAPTYSLLCDLSLIWVFKIIFPFFFSFTPLTLYQVYQRADFSDYKFDSKLALLSAFVFIFYYGFFKDMPDKQHIAEFFLALILMLVVTKIPSRTIIALLFSFSLITSHYGVSYVFMLSLIFALILFYIWNKKEGKIDLLTPNFVLFFSAIAIGWYMYVASGGEFEVIINIGSRVFSKTLSLEIFKPDCRSGISYIAYKIPTITWQIYKFVHILLQLFIFVGIVRLLVSIINRKVRNAEVAYLSIAFYSLLAFQIFTTYGMGFDRVLQITLVMLSPFAVIGCVSIFRAIRIVIKYISLEISTFTFSFSAIKLFAVFLMIFFLFNSGFIFTIIGDTLPPYCIALNKSAGWPVYTQEELSGVMWLRRQEVENVWAISFHDALILRSFYPIEYYKIRGKKLPPYVLVYVGKLVSEDQKYSNLLLLNNIYSNNRSKVYWKSGS